MSKVDLFIEQFVEFVKGDDAAALGAKVKRQAIAALESQISSLKGDTADLEQAYADAKDSVSEARINNGVAIEKGSEGRAKYVDQLLRAVNARTKAEEALEIHNKKIETLESQLQQVSL